METSQMYLNLAGSFFVAFDRKGKILMVNQKVCNILGYKESDLIGRDWFRIALPVSKVKQTKALYNQMFKSSKPSFPSFEYQIQTRKGERLYILWHNTVIADEFGNILGALCSGEDITRQRNTEMKLLKLTSELEQRVKERTHELEDNQLLFRSIARHFPNGVINVLDRNLNYVFVEGMEMFKRGITGDMLIGTSFLQRVDTVIRQELKEKLMMVFKGRNQSTEMQSEGKTYMVNAVGLRGSDKKVNRVLLVTQNITNLKKAEENIQRSLENEKQLNELKSRFVSMASHEFRTPLTSVLNSVSLLFKCIGLPDQAEKQIKHIERIRSSVHHLTSILNDFLSLDKLEEGKIELLYTEFDLDEFIQEIVKDIQEIAKNGQTITYRHSGKSGMFLDKQMLKIIFNNLLSNAIKYSPENSTVKFETTIENGRLSAQVQDEGIGIPEEEHPHVFGRFFRAKNATNIQGTGLGLNIVKKYVEMAGGDISFKSKLNKGTTFRISLPEGEIKRDGMEINR